MEDESYIQNKSEQKAIEPDTSNIYKFIVDNKKYNMLIDYNDENIIFAINGDGNESSHSASYELEKIVNILELNPKKYDTFEKVYRFISKSISKKE